MFYRTVSCLRCQSLWIHVFCLRNSFKILYFRIIWGLVCQKRGRKAKAHILRDVITCRINKSYDMKSYFYSFYQRLFKNIYIAYYFHPMIKSALMLNTYLYWYPYKFQGYVLWIMHASTGIRVTHSSPDISNQNATYYITLSCMYIS